MAISLSLKPVDYVLECDRELPAEEQTIFKLKPLSMKTSAELGDIVREDNGISLNRGEQIVFILNKCLVGWSNFKDDKGKEIKFDGDLSRLLTEWGLELFNKINEISTLGVTAKN